MAFLIETNVDGQEFETHVADNTDVMDAVFDVLGTMQYMGFDITEDNVVSIEEV